MGDTSGRAAAPNLLHYRPWKGVFRPPFAAVWPIARTGLLMLLRRKLFWGLYALSLMIFLMYFFGQYLLAWFQTQAGETRIVVGLVPIRPGDLIELLADRLKLNGSADTYRNFIHYQGYMVMIVLALAGSVLIGNDFRYGSLPFYLSKPLSRRHYLLGKGLAVAAFINLMTTLPALVLYVEYGLVYSWDHFTRNGYLVVGILGYGAVLTVTLTLLLLATAAWLRRTVPLIMTWTALFLLCRQLATALVDGLHLDPRWRLIDLWNDTALMGAFCLQMGPEAFDPTTQPALVEAALVLGGVCLACLSYLALRLRAVEVVG
jgi:ABC-2 type transport system permease protein